ncbi:MAG TPA: P1 family peptidase [Desulfomonilaceae bacterium]|nr:P1 family peptidase [Desulfomonilaceae bacterium]
MKIEHHGFHDDITDVQGIRVGNSQNIDAKTGVTVILPGPDGARAGIYVAGPAASTRQMDSLSPFHVVDRIHALCLCGGSAFGLDAAGGVLAFLEEQGIGLPVVGRTIPIVPAAAIFDLNLGNGAVRPDAAMGRQACQEASSGPIEQGSVGAGTGASVGKLFGIEQAMKGGLGSASAVSDDVVVGVLVVVNAYGDITDINQNLLAGVRIAPKSLELADSAILLKEGKAASRRVSVENTTLSVVAVNARFNKVEASRIAAQATLGLGRVIRPFRSQIDGDLTVVLSVGEQEVDLNRIGLLAAEALQRAVIKAIQFADGFGILPSWQDTVRLREHQNPEDLA